MPNILEHREDLREDLRARVVGSLAYLCFLAIAGTSVLIIVVIFFVPKYEPIFEKLRAKNKLPELTTYLVDFSNFLQSWQGLLAAVIGVMGFVVLVRTIGTASIAWADKGMPVDRRAFRKLKLMVRLSEGIILPVMSVLVLLLVTGFLLPVFQMGG